MAFHRANRSHLPSLGVKGHNAWSQRYWTLWTGEGIYDWKDLRINASESLSVSEHFFDPLKLKQKTLLCISFDSDAKVWNKTPVCFKKKHIYRCLFYLVMRFLFLFFFVRLKMFSWLFLLVFAWNEADLGWTECVKRRVGRREEKGGDVEEWR